MASAHSVWQIINIVADYIFVYRKKALSSIILMFMVITRSFYLTCIIKYMVYCIAKYLSRLKENKFKVTMLKTIFNQQNKAKKIMDSNLTVTSMFRKHVQIYFRVLFRSFNPSAL